MLNSGKTFCVARNKKINILTLVLSEKTFLNETKTITPPPPPPPFKLNGRTLTYSMKFVKIYSISKISSQITVNFYT